MKKGQIYVCRMCGNTVQITNVGGGKLVCCNVPMEKDVAEIRPAKMAADGHVILGIHVTDRAQHAADVQGVLTEFGCGIKTRLGLHDVHDGACSPNGLMLIEFGGSEQYCADMLAKLATIAGVEVQRMLFAHP